MIGIGRRLLLVLTGAVGLIAGSGGFLALGLTGVAPPPLPPAAATQEWEITLDLTDAFLAEQIDTGGAGNQYALRDVRVTSRDDGTVVINATITATLGGNGTPPAGRPGLPFPLPGSATPAVAGEFVLRPGVRDGRLIVDVERASLGPLPVPPNLGQLLENPLNRQVANTMGERPFRVVGVATRQGAVIVRAAREGR